MPETTTKRPFPRIVGCPPCTGDCVQGRACPAHECEPRGPGEFRWVVLGLALFWAAVAVVWRWAE
jgi:hypothetical protein